MILIISYLIALTFSKTFSSSSLSQTLVPQNSSPLISPLFDPDKDCPPCFNCLLPAFRCSHFSECSHFDGRCICPPGFGGDDCLQPVCGALSDGKKRPIRQDKECDCSDGWFGINCNVCRSDDACNAMIPTHQNATCYKGGLVVHENHQMCDVTNRKILDMLPGQPPQVTFACNRNDTTCGFQFWIDQEESFYCKLDECEFSEKTDHDSHQLIYACPKIQCECVPDRMLCGREGSIDITDFLVEEIKGPASFECTSNKGCVFQEPAMNNLILSVFGDSYITLQCESGECLHYTEVPGFQRPPKTINMNLILVSIVASIFFLLFTIVGIYCLSKRKSPQNYLPLSNDDESAKLMDEHTPSALMFHDINYEINGKNILNNVHGIVKPGQIMAIMGASGAGKTSFLDILARKNKKGIVSGDILVNGQVVPDDEFKQLVGHVDQQDTLLPTLTVYETVLYSALLRLPRTMSLSAKRMRVIETLRELGLLHIRDQRIGSEGVRGISGGEKRRVSIACELVTSPSILFLDEPTSGLDSYNAYNVIESLVSLAKDYNRTIVFTIHQPRSNIFALFDQLLLLADGHLIFSGPAGDARSFFDGIGYQCPLGFNIADYLIDITKQGPKPVEVTSMNPESHPLIGDSGASNEPFITSDNPALATSQEESPGYVDEYNPWSSYKAAFSTPSRQDGDSSSTTSKSTPRTKIIREEIHAAHIQNLAEHFSQSYFSSNIMHEINRLKIAFEEVSRRESSSSSGDISFSTTKIRSFQRPTWLTQFKILSDRTFKNLYRNPMLMLTHYCISIVLAILCGLLFYQVTNDISGFQNRMGIFFFMCSLFGFGCLTSLQVFSSERILFVRERANHYYSPFTYFCSKVLFDIIPLRVIPPLMMGTMIYQMVGLVEGTDHFLKFLLVLVLFNLTAASICLFLGIIFEELSVANLISSLVMLFSMLFGGLLLNRDSIPPYLQWLQRLSFFNYAFEAMIVNEMRTLQLREKKYGLEIDVPAATILSTFGFDASAYWFDVMKLGITFGTFLFCSFLCLQFFVKERR